MLQSKMDSVSNGGCYIVTVVEQAGPRFHEKGWIELDNVILVLFAVGYLTRSSLRKGEGLLARARSPRKFFASSRSR